MREVLLVVSLLAAGLSLAPASADAGPVVVAVLDTGLDASHPEFAPGQVVAWWDFTEEGTDLDLPGPGDVQDPRGIPEDWHGHGTATASLVGGANTGAGDFACGKTSYAPGVQLAIAKVATVDETISPLAPAIRWAVDVAGADVISISIASIVPAPPFLGTVEDAIAEARAKGVLVVVSVGNGVGNAAVDTFGVPYPSEAALYAYSPDALSVGASGRFGPSARSTDGNLDPEVVAWSQSVCVAGFDSDGYETMSGTSFSTPLVAGAAASAMADARAAGRPSDPQTIETVLKHAAKDSLLPYAKEGWGFIGDDEVAAARAAAASGTLPAHPCAVEPCTDPVYEAAVADNARLAMETLPAPDPFALVGEVAALGGAHLYVPLDGNGAGTLGASTPVAGEVEVYGVPLAAGATGTVTMAYVDAVVAVPLGVSGLALGEDADLRIYRPGALDDGLLDASEMVLVVGNGAGEDESATWTAAMDGTYLAVAYGWSVARDVRIDVSGATFIEEGLLVGQSVLA